VERAPDRPAAAQFAADPAAVIAELLRRAGRAQGAVRIKSQLVAAGVPAAEVDRAWPRARRALTARPDVAVIGRSYAWHAAPTDGGALRRQLDDVSARCAELARRCEELTERCVELEVALRSGPERPAGLRAAQERQLRIDLIRALAEVAMEVEELAFNGADADVMIERIRALVDAYELEPIGRAGEEGRFDPARHAPIGARPGDGSRVSVVRPGYTWRAADGEVLIGKAQVAPV
jgi:hypothetical protein